MTAPRFHRRPAGSRSAFTLTELMIAVIVLIGVLLATSKIFSTTSKVTGMGEAGASVMQEAAAIERQMREDIEQLSREGFFAIRCVAVPNNYYVGRLINPSLPANADVRADQLVFFRTGVSTSQTYRVGLGSNKQAQGLMSRVSYSHAFQFGESAESVDFSGDSEIGIEPHSSVRPTPWIDGPVRVSEVTYEPRDDRYDEDDAGTIDVALEDARRWLFARQSAMMVDDDRGVRNSLSKTVFLNNVLTARSLFHNDPGLGLIPELRNGRIDAVATEMTELKALLRSWGPWAYENGGADQFSLISNQLVMYPRAEREAPSMHRLDQALTSGVMGSSVSSVRIEWTYDFGTGYTEGNGDGTGFCPVEYAGHGFAGTDPGWSIPQPWYGIPRANLGTELYRDSPYRPETIMSYNIERYPVGGWDVEVYEAIFGPNESRALDFNDDGCLVPEDQLPNDARYNIAFTPWPSAIRVTLTLHDTSTRLEHGREVQFIIRLPKRDVKPF